MTSSRQAILDATRAMTAAPSVGNLAPLPGIYPDYAAPIVRNTPEGRELALARWGMPKPAFALQGKRVDSGVTNVRNTASNHWRRWLGQGNRCLVPFTSFCEPGRDAGGKSVPVWFGLPGAPLAFFAGITVSGWTSVRKLKEGEVTADLFGFLTAEANMEVGRVHPKAMPVILTEPDELELWMTGSWTEARCLQRPLPDGALQVLD